MTIKNDLKTKYEKEIRPALQKELGIKNIHAVPSIEKVVINIGLGRMSQAQSFEEKVLPLIEKELSIVCGQKPARAGAKKSIAGFKLRQGQVIGLKVTLRGSKMYGFIDKIIKIVLPRTKDFRGLNLKNVDKAGNFNIGFKEQVVFPEIEQDISTVDFGMQATVVPTIKKRNESIIMYKKLGFLFKKQ